MGVYEPASSTLLYGGPGSGKTALAVSSFWDWRKQEQIANGKLITLGGEDNPALMVPQKCRETAKGTSLRLVSPLLDGQQFLEQLNLILRRLVADAEEGHPLDVLVIDSLSEFDLLYEHTFAGGDDNFAKWDGLLANLFALMMCASHTALKCQVIMTARVMEKKKAKMFKTSSVAGDPDYVDFDYYPSLRGSFRLHLPHYFNMVLYQETALARNAAGKVVPVHKTNLVRSGGYYVKNVWEHQWLEHEPLPYVVNASWPTIWTKLTGAIAKARSTPEEEITELVD